MLHRNFSGGSGSTALSNRFQNKLYDYGNHETW